jgi:hypothetical protein
LIDISLPVPADRPFPLRTVLACLTIIAGLVAWQAETDRLRSDGVPAGLQATMTYEHVAGNSFMPGSNKALLRVFVFPTEVAAAIEEGKRPFLEARFTDDHYAEWHETPVLRDERWTAIKCECVDPTEGPLGSFIEKSAFHVTVDPAVEKTINEALLVSGSYYAYGAHNLLLVIPSKAIAVYAFIK